MWPFKRQIKSEFKKTFIVMIDLGVGNQLSKTFKTLDTARGELNKIKRRLNIGKKQMISINSDDIVNKHNVTRISIKTNVMEMEK